MESFEIKENKKCQDCGEEILSTARKCKYCGSFMEENLSQKSDYGLFLLAVPVSAIFLIWFWVGEMTLIQNPSSLLNLIIVFTIFATALIAGLELQKTSPAEDRPNPIIWFFYICCFWLACYPLYLYKRKDFGLKSLIIPGMLLLVLLTSSYMYVWISIDKHRNEIKSEYNESVEQIDQFFQNW